MPADRSAEKGDEADSRAFPRLNDEELLELEKFGEHKLIPAGESVWSAGDADVCMFVVASGAMVVKDGRTGNVVGKHEVGGFSGDTDVINGRPALVSAEAETDLDVLVISGENVRSIVSERPEIGSTILRAFLMRRERLQDRSDVGVRIIGSRFSGETLRLREFLARNRYPHTWDDLERLDDTRNLLKEFKVSEAETPLAILPNGKLLKAPSVLDLAQELGVSHSVEDVLFDVVIVGAGPAGLAAAVYGASEGLNTLVIEAESPGGQAGTSSRIENYMGFPLGLSGQDLCDRAVNQAEKFGARLVLPACVEAMECDAHGAHTLKVETLGDISCRCVILAPGASYRKLDIANLEQFENRGVYYAATRIEQTMCTEESAIVVGGGNSAGQAAIFMSFGAQKVVLVVRGNDLRKQMSSYLARRIESSDKIEVRLNSEVCALHGKDHLQSATVLDHSSGKKEKLDVAGLFVMIGAVPRTEWLPSQITRDDDGFILTGPDVENGHWTEARHPFFLETSCRGVFAAGDARSGSVKRVASAVGEGSMAVAFIHQFLTL